MYASIVIGTGAQVLVDDGIVVLTHRVYHLLHTGLEQMKDRCGQIAAINFIRSSPYITGTIL